MKTSLFKDTATTTNNTIFATAPNTQQCLKNPNGEAVIVQTNVSQP